MKRHKLHKATMSIIIIVITDCNTLHGFTESVFTGDSVGAF